MKLYHFSPINSKEKLREAIEYVHFACHTLCKDSFGSYLSNAGNVGIFCHYDEEYEFLTALRKELTEDTDNVNQKYFRLHEPIVIPAHEDVPETTYTFLYIRRPDPYRSQVGDIDFFLPQNEYEELKQLMLDGKSVQGARVFERPDLDMIELHNPDIDALGYVSTAEMSEAVRVKLSEATKL